MFSRRLCAQLVTPLPSMSLGQVQRMLAPQKLIIPHLLGCGLQGSTGSLMGKRKLIIDIKTENGQVPDFSLSLSSTSKVQLQATPQWTLHVQAYICSTVSVTVF